MITVVLDTNTVVSAIFWPRSTARRCLAGLARRQYGIAVSRDVFEEYEAVDDPKSEQYRKHGHLHVKPPIRVSSYTPVPGRPDRGPVRESLPVRPNRAPAPRNGANYSAMEFSLPTREICWNPTPATRTCRWRMPRK